MKFMLFLDVTPYSVTDRYLSTKLHGVTSQQTISFTKTKHGKTLRISDGHLSQTTGKTNVILNLAQMMKQLVEIQRRITTLVSYLHPSPTQPYPFPLPLSIYFLSPLEQRIKSKLHPSDGTVINWLLPPV
jgi:hypothetical protein